MRTVRLLGGMSLVLACAWTAHAEPVPYETTITVPDVEVRSGPSADPKMYATGKLRQGDRVRVVKEVEGLGLGGGELVALNADGSLRWRFPIGGRTYSSPAVGSDGAVYVGSWDKHLYCVEERPGPSPTVMRRPEEPVDLDE